MIRIRFEGEELSFPNSTALEVALRVEPLSARELDVLAEASGFGGVPHAAIDSDFEARSTLRSLAVAEDGKALDAELARSAARRAATWGVRA